MDKQIVLKEVLKLSQKIASRFKVTYNYLSIFLGGQTDGHHGRRRSGVAVAQVRLLHEGHR